jgi:RNA polymerase sigma-70 factor (ECF subfamily)
LLDSSEANQTGASEHDWVELVRRIGAGDEQAFRALYDRTHRIVFTFLMRISKNGQTAEELTLDVFHDVWRSADRYDPNGGTVLGWIMNQARSRAIDRLRFDRRKKRVATNGELAGAAAATCEPAAAAELDEQARVLREALGTLTPDERHAIETAFFSELSHAETAALLGQPLGTVKTRVRSGLAKLRKALAREGRDA